MSNVINKIICADVMDGLKMIPDGIVDLTCSSPPYCLKQPYANSNDDQPYQDYLKWLKNVFAQVYLATKSGGRCAINIDAMTNRQEDKDQEYVRCIYAHLYQLMVEIGWKFRTEICWSKQNAVGKATAWGSYCSASNPVIRRNHEYILVFSKDKWVLDGDNELSDMTKEEFCEYTLSTWFIRPETRNLAGHPCVYPEELVKRIVKLFSYRDSVILDPFNGCYDEATEVLTKNGWKYFKDVTLNDNFLTRPQDGDLEYHKPIAKQKYWHKGKMIKIKSRSTDLLVTPNHNMYVLTHANQVKGGYCEFVRADDLNFSSYYIPCGGKFNGGSSDISKDMMRLIGLYVSEGYIEKIRGKLSTNVIICQNQGKKWDIMWDWLQPFKPAKRDHRRIKVKLNQEQLNFLIKNCGQSKYDKFLSPAILNNNSLRELYDAMILGDGSTSFYVSKLSGEKHPYQSYYTTSLMLKNSFQELCVKIGYNSSCGHRGKRRGKIDKRRVESTTPCYKIRVGTSKNRKIIPNEHVMSVDYDGYVYCVTVPNHTLFVRRNGKVAWCGNSGTTAYIAKTLHRKYIGIDNSPNYCQYAEERLAKADTLFDDDNNYVSRSKRLEKKEQQEKEQDMFGNP